MELSDGQFAGLVSAYEAREREPLLAALATMLPLASAATLSELRARYSALKDEALSLSANQLRHVYLHAFLSTVAGKDYLFSPDMRWLADCLTDNFTHHPHFGAIENLFDEVIEVLAENVETGLRPFDRSRVAPAAGVAFLKSLPPGAIGIGPVLPCDTRPPPPNDEAFRLVNPRTGRPIAGARYEIEAEGTLYQGETDKDGFTQRIFTGFRTSPVRVSLVEDEAAMQVTPLDDHGCL